MPRMIERFLSTNSELIPTNVTSVQTVRVDQRSKMRPDKIFGATASMKWAMVLNGIDSPYMMARGRMFAQPEPSSLNSELVELEEFEL